MIKLLLTTVLIAVFSFSIYTQSDTDDVIPFGYSKELTIEPFISYSSSGFVLEDDYSPTERVYNFAAGVFLDYHFNPRWSIRSGIIYDKIGDGIFLLTNTNGNTKRYNRTYISIPVMMNLHFGKRKRWNLGFGVTQSIGSENEFLSILNGQDDMKNFMSASFEIGYAFPVGPGFIHITSNGMSSFSKTLSVFSQSRSLISVGYILRI